MICVLLHPSLSALGHEQVAELPNSVNSFLDSVELVVVSPLSRAIKTCLGAFDPEKVRNILSYEDVLIQLKAKKTNKQVSEG